jgi:peptidoglycan/LPS O-acetylase OafA/YrhL
MTSSTAQTQDNRIPAKAVHPSTVFLDGLRGLAALYVVLGHARLLLWEGYSSGYALHPASYSKLQKLLVYAISSVAFGHEAVLFFFVLSGLVIHLRYSRHLKQSPQSARFGWLDYCYRRVRRLYPPLLFAMAVTFCVDHAGMANHFSIYSGTSAYPGITESIHTNYGTPVFLGNLAFFMEGHPLKGVYIPAWGTDGPLWSLKYEWWFYMIYPLFWLLTRRSITLATTVMAGLAILAVWPQYWPVPLLSEVMAMMGTWWIGALLADVLTGRIRMPLRWLALLTLFLPIGLIAKPHVGSLLDSYLWAFGFAGLICAGFELQNRGYSLWVLNRLRILGDMSYTLYIVHLPILVFLSGLIMARNGGRLPRHFGFVVLGTLLVVAVAYAAHFFVELPFRGGPRGARDPEARRRV